MSKALPEHLGFGHQQLYDLICCRHGNAFIWPSRVWPLTTTLSYLLRPQTSLCLNIQHWLSTTVSPHLFRPQKNLHLNIQLLAVNSYILLFVAAIEKAFARLSSIRLTITTLSYLFQPQKVLRLNILRLAINIYISLSGTATETPSSEHPAFCCQYLIYLICYGHGKASDWTSSVWPSITTLSYLFRPPESIHLDIQCSAVHSYILLHMFTAYLNSWSWFLAEH